MSRVYLELTLDNSAANIQQRSHPLSLWPMFGSLLTGCPKTLCSSMNTIKSYDVSRPNSYCDVEQHDLGHCIIHGWKVIEQGEGL